MSIGQQEVERIVSEVLSRLQGSVAAPCAASGGDFGLFDQLEDAVSAAEAAYPKVNTIAMREKVIAAIRAAGVQHAEMLARMAVEETGMGRVADKITKNVLEAERTPGTECLAPMAITGDLGLTLIENAPWGVIASVTPSTNPAATVINNSISMIAGGNAIVFAPHPGAKRTSQKAIQLLNQAIVAATGIENLLVAVKEPTIEVAQQLFSHPRVKLLVVTGGEAVVEAARKHATMRLIAAGAGNPPVVVDETADIKRAAVSIYTGATFDNNIICADEKEIIAVDCIADSLKQELKALGAVEISLDQADAIARIVLRNYPGPKPSANPKWVGRDAAVIAKAAGISVPDSCRMLLVDVGRDVDHVFARTEQMMPVLPLLRAHDVDEAINWALILERGLSHTAGMHSRHIDHMDKMARLMNTSLFVKNGPHIAALGAGGEGWTTMTISTPTGEGVTCARSFVRLRRCCVVNNFRIV
ncbi:MAG TPA: aldehyde dehydrogenase EutE [Candidatus Avidesulfovibrio excrementigallinarum]|nr:aldehyde dehydrogenase EutE [Candidatus Avidesulfovibrio excrementigallinarum]